MILKENSMLSLEYYQNQAEHVRESALKHKVQHELFFIFQSIDQGYFIFFKFGWQKATIFLA